MSATPDVTSTSALGPVTAAELLAALDAWQEETGPRSGSSPVTARREDDTIVVKADLETLSRRRMSLELTDDALRLRRRAGDRAIPLWFFEGAARTDGRQLTIRLSPRPPQQVREAAQRTFGPANRELWHGIQRMLDVAESTPVHAALVARAAKALAGVVEQADERAAAQAVAESLDPLALVRLLEDEPGIDALREAEPLAPARLRGIVARQRLLEMAGGALSVEEAADTLGLTRQAVDKRRRAGKLLAISLGRRGFRYPACQFARGGVLPGLEKVLDALREHDPWMQLSFFVNRNSDLNDRSPIGVLQQRGAGGMESVLRAAAVFGEHGAA